VDTFVARVAGPSPTPGGGSVAAHAGALGAALAQMVTGLSIGRKKYAAHETELRALAADASALRRTLTELVTRDADSYEAVRSAYQLTSDTGEAATAATARTQAIHHALYNAADVPLETAHACARVCELAASVAKIGNQNAVSDATVAALLAEAACKGAIWNVRINVHALRQEGAEVSAGSRAAKLLDDAMDAALTANTHARLAEQQAEISMGEA